MMYLGNPPTPLPITKATGIVGAPGIQTIMPGAIGPLPPTINYYFEGQVVSPRTQTPGAVSQAPTYTEPTLNVPQSTYSAGNYVSSAIQSNPRYQTVTNQPGYIPTVNVAPVVLPPDPSWHRRRRVNFLRS
jgi:hypothetical protein